MIRFADTKRKPDEAIGARVEEIRKAGGWTSFPDRNCFLRHGSGEFPDGSTGDSDGDIIRLDECLLKCQDNKDCDGVLVQANEDYVTCSLRARVSLPDCYSDEGSYSMWLRGSIEDHVDKLRAGWTLHDGLNCFEGSGSAEWPGSYHDEKASISLNECMIACEEDAMCEGVSFRHAEQLGPCGFRAWLELAECDEGSDFDFWMLDSAGAVDAGSLPSGGQGRDRLAGVLDMIAQAGFQQIDLSTCALVGASSAMSGSSAGDEIDGHTAVIRLNRMPTADYFTDFGGRTDILFLSKDWSGGVSLMGGEDAEVKNCADVPACVHAAIVARGDLDRCDPNGLAAGWGPAHPFVGCQHKNISRIAATGFTSLQGSLPSGGMQAFFTFLPVCGQLNLYGFGGTEAADAADTADGHTEWSGHNLFEEHTIQDKIAAGQWDDLPWKREFREVEWLRANAAAVRKVVGTVP